MKVTRAQVLGYRIAAQGLDRDRRRIVGLAVLDIGVQDSVAEGARLASMPGSPRPRRPAAIGPDKAFALVWSLRGAPHVHRRRDLDSVAPRPSGPSPRRRRHPDEPDPPAPAPGPG